MPTFMLISKHAPESCWMVNEKTRQIHANLVDKLGSLLEKHQIKMLGCWFDLPGHTLYEVYDVPTLEALQKMVMEPEIAAWTSFNTMQVINVTPVEEVMGLLRTSG